MSFNGVEVVGVGAATLDRLVLVEAFPGEEGVTEMLAEVTDGGGPVATALCVLGSLGRRCVLVDWMGDDAEGEAIRQGLERFGVGREGLAMVAGGSSAEAVILVRRRDGARHILFRPGAGGGRSEANLKLEWFQTARLLHLNGRHEVAARAAVRLAEEARVRVSFDGGAGRYRESIRDLVRAAHIVIVAREFAARFAGIDDLPRAAAVLLSAPKTEVVVITDGVSGSWVWSRQGESFHQPALVVPDVVDTTGCGDIYHGAFLHGWLSDWPLKRSAEFASEWAARNARGLGGRHALRDQSR